MCRSLWAWSVMAPTTCGWQWPVALTAMPAVKSRKRVPSTSSMTAPLPRSTTRGEIRVEEGETPRAPPSVCLGHPLGPFHLVPVVDGPGTLVGDRLDQARRGRMAVAAFLHSAKGEVYLRSDARQVDVTHAELALFAKQSHG